jgi:hypothetical protein
VKKVGWSSILVAAVMLTVAMVANAQLFGILKNKGLDRFSLHGKKKVNTQWQLFSLVHNIEKITYAGAV